jgi:hypothetical protein
MYRRLEEIRLRQRLGGELAPHELMCLQMEQSGFGCASGRRLPPLR